MTSGASELGSSSRTQEAVNEAQQDADQDIGFLEVLAVPIRRWRVVALSIGAATAVAITFMLFWPVSYTARTVLVPATDNSGAGAQIFAGQLSTGLAGLLPTASSHEKLIGAVLKSRSIADSLVSRSGITPYSGTAGEREIRLILQKRTRVQSNPDGSFAIEVRDADAERATRIANEIPELTNLILSHVVRSAARRRQEFLESQVRNANEQLELSERQLVSFQQMSETPEIQEQARRTMEAAAELQNRIIQQEIRVSQIRRSATAENPEYRAAVAELNDWRAQLLRITTGEHRQNQVFLSLRESPELRAAATRILREYNKNEQVYLSLTAALAEAQVNSQNQLPVVSVLDNAIVPLSPSGLNPLLLLALAVALGGVAGIGIAFAAEYLGRARDDPGSREFFLAWKDFRTDLERLSRGRTLHGSIQGKGEVGSG
jgi:tyrosine-protein kinase Etk/Wzc